MTEAERHEFIRKMDARRLETPFLRITEKCKVEQGKRYVVTGIMAKDKLRFDVRDEAGGLIFAEAAQTPGGCRNMPVAEVNAETVKHVLLEYDVAEIGSLWPRSIAGELACQVGSQSVSCSP